MSEVFLKGVRVIALTQVWAGAWTGHLLSDMGAEVIKIESSTKLELYRRGKEGLNKESHFNAYNNGVKSCTLNMKQPEAVEIFKKLVKISDVIIENLSPRAMPGFGLGYDTLKQIKPDIIMVSEPGFGSTGPDKNYISYASTVEAVGGLAASFGYPGGEPATPSIFLADPTGGMYGALCVVGAIFHHRKTGKGQHIDVAQSEAITTFLPEVIMEYSMNGRIRPRMGNRDAIMAPHSCYPCKGRDKWVAIAVGTNEEWKAMRKVMGNPEWSKDEKFADQYSRWQNQDELNKLVGSWTKDFTHYDVMHLLQKAGVAAGVSFSTKEMYNDPHVKDRGALIEKDHLEGGKVLTWRAPWKSALTAQNPTAPLFGQHNSYVFQELLGMSDAEMAKLVEQKVIY